MKQMTFRARQKKLKRGVRRDEWTRLIKSGEGRSRVTVTYEP